MAPGPRRQPQCDGAKRLAPLHEAAAFDRPECIRTLLDAGADRTRASTDGETALDIAVRLEMSEAIAALTRID